MFVTPYARLGVPRQFCDQRPKRGLIDLTDQIWSNEKCQEMVFFSGFSEPGGDSKSADPRGHRGSPPRAHLIN